MVARAIVAALLLVGTLVPVSTAMNGDRTPRHHQSAMVRFERPTWVAGELLIGSYLIVHDEDKMTRGEPCTALYRVHQGTLPLEEVVSFHCIPHEREVVPAFTCTIKSNPALGIDTVDTLTEYQFAGDSEGHGVPIGAPALVSNRLHAPE
jgi:hypothetical protein